MLLKTRIILGVMAGLALVIVGLVAGRLYSDGQSESRYETLAINNQGVLWQKIIDGQIQAIEAGISGLTRNREALQGLAQEDDTMLGEAVKGVFNRMSTQKIISRLHLADLTGTLVYSSTGDLSATSPLARVALDRGEVVSGVLEDVDGTIQVAVATPLFHRGKPAGVGLLMRDINAALTSLERSIEAHIAIFDTSGRRVASTDPSFFDKGVAAGPVVDDQQARVQFDGLTFTTTPTPVLDYAGQELGTLLSARDETGLITQRQRGDLVSYGLTALLLCLVIGALYLYISRNFKALADITGALGRLAEGETVDLPGRTRSDELGQLVRSTDRIFQKGLEATRLRSALDGCDMMIMVANRRGEIIYQNDALKTYFGRNQQEIQKAIPGFDANEIIGSSIDAFHRDSGGIRHALEHLTDRRRFVIQLGGRRLRLAVSPIRARDGSYLGTVVEWADATAEIDVQSQIDRVVAAARKGNFKDRISTAEKGAYASIAAGVNALNQQIEATIDDVTAVLGAIANGRLEQRITADYEGKFGELRDHVNDTAERLTSIVTGIKTTAKEVAAAAAEIGSGTEDLAGRTERAAASLEETAAAAEQLAATVRQNAENAGKASELSESADKIAGQGGEVVKSAVLAMAGIDQSAEKITAIISVIDEIAFQTNLLALNASVEAARAGEAGKGFAVVAQEVRQLAQRSAQAASDIKALIQHSNHQVKDGVSLVNQAGEALTEIVAAIGAVAKIVRDISAASQEQSLGVQNINSSIAGMDDMTQQNSALVEQSSASARTLSDQAAELTEAMAFFHLQNSPAETEPPKRRRPEGQSTRLKTREVAEADWAEF
ncbi:MAG: methyl-accepting chemotaxis protein [Alphaproteobacteria bacterium]